MFEQQLYLSAYTYLLRTPTLFGVLPFLVQGVLTIRGGSNSSNNRVSLSNYNYWTITHPYLSDDDNPRTSYRAQYRMNRANLERLVNNLSQHQEFRLLASNALPFYVQISISIWRLTDSHNVYWTINHG